MKTSLRQELPEDQPLVEDLVEDLVERAFRNAAFSDQSEHHLVHRLRQSDAFIPELSIVAEQAGQLVGHVLVTKISIRNEENTFPALALAPISVAPSHQGQGIGGQLMREAHRVARERGHQCIVLLGHADYYPRFGYQRASQYGIQLPFAAPDENCMVLDLQGNGLPGVQGQVVYSAPFTDPAP